MAHVDHAVQAGAKEVGRRHWLAFKNSHKLISIESIPESSGYPKSPEKASNHAGYRAIAGPTTQAGSTNASPRFNTAQAIRAFFAAMATMARQ
jgi:hypothetical protein